MLALEMDTLWGTDDRGRLCGPVHPWPQLAIAAGSDGRTVAIGSDIPDDLCDELRGVACARPWAEGIGEAPHALVRCIELLGRLGEVEVTSGPSFVVSVVDAPGVQSKVGPALRRSSGSDEDLIPLRPVDWEPGEWRDLVAGDLGPWAMSVEHGQVTALCHSSRLTERAAEAGLWTHPDFRRQGRASTVTAAWAAHAGLGDRVRFYSTSSDNTASQRVAAGLALRPIGWMWKLSVERTTD